MSPSGNHEVQDPEGPATHFELSRDTRRRAPKTTQAKWPILFRQARGTMRKPEKEGGSRFSNEEGAARHPFEGPRWSSSGKTTEVVLSRRHLPAFPRDSWLRSM